MTVPACGPAGRSRERPARRAGEARYGRPPRPRRASLTATRLQARLAASPAGGTVRAMSTRIRTLIDDIARAGQTTRRRQRI